MNRKMRANLNNKIAKARKERKSCPMAGVIQQTDQEKCDGCGRDLVPVVAIYPLEQVPDRKQMN